MEKKILIIEDEVAIHKILKIILKISAMLLRPHHCPVSL